MRGRWTPRSNEKVQKTASSLRMVIIRLLLYSHENPWGLFFLSFMGGPHLASLEPSHVCFKDFF